MQAGNGHVQARAQAHALERHAPLLGAVAVAPGDRLILQRLPVDGDAERRPCLVLPSIAPADGAAPRALTPVRKSGPDLGDLDAWALPSGLYLQSAGACGTLELNKQAANCSVSPVTVPGLTAGGGASIAVVTALGSRLLVHGLGCTLGGQLAWLNPATGTENWLFKTGAEIAVPYYSTENGAFR